MRNDELVAMAVYIFRYYELGRCKRGSLCPYAHPSLGTTDSLISNLINRRDGSASAITNASPDGSAVSQGEGEGSSGGSPVNGAAEGRSILQKYSMSKVAESHGQEALLRAKHMP